MSGFTALPPSDDDVDPGSSAVDKTSDVDGHSTWMNAQLQTAADKAAAAAAADNAAAGNDDDHDSGDDDEQPLPPPSSEADFGSPDEELRVRADIIGHARINM